MVIMKTSGVAKQAITLISSVMALLSTFKLWTSKSKSSETKDKKSMGTSTLIVIWTVAQYIRVIFFR